MNKADELLKLIENVDVDDSNALDEIDRKTHSFITKISLFSTFSVGYMNKNGISAVSGTIAKQYTTSRDALKSIRPDGWRILINEYKDNLWTGIISHPKHKVYAPSYLPTEELAELHAIIQAIEWERNND